MKFYSRCGSNGFSGTKNAVNDKSSRSSKWSKTNYTSDRRGNRYNGSTYAVS